MRKFNEDTRVKIPATLHFLKIGYSYQSKNNADIDFNTKIFVNRFKPALEKINGKNFNDTDIATLLSEIHALIRNNDLGRSWYLRLTDKSSDIRLIDFNNLKTMNSLLSMNCLSRLRRILRTAHFDLTLIS